MRFSILQNKSTFLTLLSVVAGITVFLGLSSKHIMSSLVSNRTSKEKPMATTTPAPDLEGPPIAVSIPKIHKSLPIKPAHVVGNNWDMFDDAVAWLATSATPGTGNVILYAHDRASLWQDLYLLKAGDSIEVQQGNAWRRYEVTASKTIDPHDIQAILSNNNQLTMYTCEGSFDQKRRVVYAKPLD